MDKETLSNHISTLGKRDFAIACRIVLEKVFGFNVVNVDGPRDGGSDFTSFADDGKRRCVGIQITTQKSDIKNKAYRDAKKCLTKLGLSRFFFLSTYRLSEEDSRKIEQEIEDELDVRTSVYDSSVIAGFLIKNSLVAEFLDETGFPDLRQAYHSTVDYKQMVLHSYTLLSSDAKNMKEQIYEDTILLVISSRTEGMTQEEIVNETINLLTLTSIKEDRIKGRIDALLAKSKIRKQNGLFYISPESKQEIENRQILYEKELETLSAAQTDIMREFSIEWTIDDARLTSVWIANTYLASQLSTLEKVDAPLSKDLYKHIDDNGIKSLTYFLIKEKKLSQDISSKVIESFISISAGQPLMKKLTSAFVYVALEGKNPMTSCRALGVNRWSQFKLLMEPTIGIPVLCSFFFKSSVNRIFDNAINAFKQSQELGIPMYVSYNYIKECAGHLHMARRYDGLELNPEEMIYSSNAFVSHYYSLKKQGLELPNTYLDYLALFSSAIKIEKEYKDWIRSMMSDIQSLFTRKGAATYIDIPMYDLSDLKDIENEYAVYLAENGIEKSKSLLTNDVITIKFTKELCSKGDHWMILTNDKTLVNVSKECANEAWITSPYLFLDMVEMTKPMDERKVLSLVHSVAKYSESTLAVGARIIDKIVFYASDKMQDWQFKKELDIFKEEMIRNLSIDATADIVKVDKMTDEFLLKHSISMKVEGETDVEMETFVE